VIRWFGGDIRAAWLRLDSGGPPADPDEASARLSGRDDDEATAMRLGWLAVTGRTADLRTALEAWTPATAVGSAQQARLTSRLALLEGGADDLELPLEAASAIPDARARVEQQARVFIEAAWRRMDRDEDPFPSLVEAKRILGDRAGEFDTDDDERVRARTRRIATALGLAPALAMAVLSFAVVTGMLG
jgi:hypothetical protein